MKPRLEADNISCSRDAFRLNHVRYLEALSAIGVVEEQLNDQVKNTRREIESHLDTICRVRRKYGLPITEDYFQLLYLEPEDLAEQTWFQYGRLAEEVNPDRIHSYLPYGQQMILAGLERNAATLERLEEKLDALITQVSR